ncbi:MAG TPA: iron export ABC transporter permease subunit FetB [Acidimicrobiales bacterium]|jgi:putative ABC transport system permease protein|nr:iron export ABC transporter permease subunit FetB [Acidimicrobiales bacterium]
MNDAAIGWAGLGLSLILVGVAVGLSLWQGLRLEKDMLWATGRALVQLLAVGYVLLFIVDPDTSILWAWAWVVLMVLVASFTARRRAPEVPGIMGLTLGATSASAALSLFVVFGLGIYPVVGRTVVPIAGMMIGNSIGSIVVASRRILGELADRRPEVEARLALGQPWQQASKPFVRSALRTALTSQIENTKAVGLVFLPGAMTGLILAGADPVDAVLVQAAIMYLILGCVATNVVLIGLGLTRRLFTPDHRLVRLARTGS